MRNASALTSLACGDLSVAPDLVDVGMIKSRPGEIFLDLARSAAIITDDSSGHSPTILYFARSVELRPLCSRYLVIH